MTAVAGKAPLTRSNGGAGPESTKMFRHERRGVRQANSRPGSPGSLNPDTKTLDRSGKLIMDDSDNYGVEMALQLASGEGDVVTLVSMAPGGETSGLRTGLAMGAAQAILVSDDALAGSDALGTAKVLAAAIRRANPDLVVMATESTDGYTGTLPVQVAELMGLPSVTFAKAISVDGSSIRVERQTEAGYDDVVCPCPPWSPSPPAWSSRATPPSRGSWRPSPSRSKT